MILQRGGKCAPIEVRVMRRLFRVCCALGIGLLWIAGFGWGQEPDLPSTQHDPQASYPATGSPPPPGSERWAMAPGMIGDLTGRFVAARAFPTDPRAPTKGLFASSAAFKIADNESPRPLDRLF